MKKYAFVAFLCMATAAALAAQTSHETGGLSAGDFIARGIKMYEDRNYNGCIDQMSEASRRTIPQSMQEIADYYIVCSKYRRGDADCLEAVSRFMEQYPASAWRYEMSAMLGDCYFFDGRFGNAVRAYEEIPEGVFDRTRRDELVYRKSFAYLKIAEYDKARLGFARLKGSSKYGEASDFYGAYIDYANGKWDEAERGFSRIKPGSRFGNEAQYYLCQLRFRDGDYENVIAGGRRLDREFLTPEMQNELDRITGESEFHVGNNARAVSLLSSYVEHCAGKPERSALYLLGISEYRSGQDDEAISRLGEVTAGEADALSQSAYLYIGQAYLRAGNMNAASMAFEKAYKMDFDRDVQETAFYNYAIAQSRGGKVPFSNSARIFQDFLNNFPNSQYAPDVEDYLIQSYLSTEDYDNALAMINALKSPSSRMLAAKQNVLYRLGMRSLESGNTDAALSYLKKADQLATYDTDVADETTLWLGEAYYRSGNYGQAKACYSSYASKAGRSAANYAVANYGLGYALFQQKDYAGAESAFGKAISAGIGKSLRADANARIGDCRYYRRDYAGAATYYDKAADGTSATTAYALFQKGFVDGLERRHNDKIALMDRVIDEYPESVYAPKAMYEKAQAYIALDNDGRARDVFNDLRTRYPQSAEARKGRLQMAMLLRADGETETAKKEYKSLIAEFPTSEEAKIAIEDLKVLYAKEDRLPEFSQYLKSIGSNYQMDASEMDRLTFQSAESAYAAGGNTDRLKSYLEQYPRGAYAGQCASYLAESAYGRGDRKEALRYAEQALASGPDAAYAETMLSMSGEIYLADNDLERAEAAYERLSRKATTPDGQRVAGLGLLRIARDKGDNGRVRELAGGLLKAGGLTADEAAEVRFARASAAYDEGDKQQAAEDYRALSENPRLLYGAMAAVRLAEIDYEAGRYDSAEKVLNALAGSGTPHQYWLARGFILLSDVYKARGDNFQAREYLESLKSNYPGKEPDISEMIETRLNALKK